MADHVLVVAEGLGIAEAFEQGRDGRRQFAAVGGAEGAQSFPFLDAVAEHLPVDRAARAGIDEELVTGRQTFVAPVGLRMEVR